MKKSKGKWGKGPCVYFISDGKYVKIGATRDLETRFANIQAMNPRELHIVHVEAVKYEDELFLTESFYHNMFKNEHIRGEWYDIKEDVTKMIKDQKALIRREREREEKAYIKKLEEWHKYPDYLTLEQIADRLQITIGMVNKHLVATKDFPKMQRLGMADRVKETEFYEFLDRHMGERL